MEWFFDATGFGGVILDGIKSLSNKSSRTQQELPIKANSTSHKPQIDTSYLFVTFTNPEYQKVSKLRDSKFFLKFFDNF